MLVKRPANTSGQRGRMVQLCILFYSTKLLVHQAYDAGMRTTILLRVYTTTLLLVYEAYNAGMYTTVCDSSIGLSY
jgi:hypothetical protein